jgi:hypothetical protein
MKLLLFIFLLIPLSLIAGLTKLRPSQCNNTLLWLNTPIYAKTILGAQAYKFQIYNPSNGDLVEYEKNTGTTHAITFGYPELIPYAYYATTYEVRVKVKINDVWEADYGDMCYLTTPAGSKVREQDNNKTVNFMHYERIFLDPCNTPGTQDYQVRYRVHGTTTYHTAITGTELTASPTDTDFKIADFNNTTLYGKTLRVSVRVLVNGTWSQWGNEKIIKVVSNPKTKLCDGTYLTSIGYIDHCGTYNDPFIISSTASILSSYNVFGFSSTTFEVCRIDNAGNIIETQTLTRQVSQFGALARSFRLNLIPSYAAGVNNTTFKIRVKTNLGAYGNECYVRVQNSIDPSPIIATPNPFSTKFSLNIPNDTLITIYNMNGQLVESNSSSENLGENLPKGIYFIKLNEETIKVIKE